MASIYIFTNFFKTLMRRGQTEETGLRRQDCLNAEQAALYRRERQQLYILFGAL